MRFLLSLLLLGPLAASGQETAPATGQIVGVVLDVDGNVLSGANVRIPPLNVGAAADQDGRFVLSDVPIGEHEVEVSYTGYEVLDIAVHVEPRQTTTLHPVLTPHIIDCTVVVHADLASLPPRLTQAATASGPEAGPTTGRIEGAVVDEETGEPLVGANVWIPLLHIGGTVDVDGRYAIEGVPPGEHTLEGRYIGYEPWTATAIVKAGTTTTASMSAALDESELECVVLCAGPEAARGVYAARVVHRVYWDCCSSKPTPLYPRPLASVVLEDR